MSSSEIQPHNRPQYKPAFDLRQRYQEFKLIGHDPVLALSLIGVGIFVFLFVAYPLIRVVWQGFFDPISGDFSLKYFAQYLDPAYQRYNWQVLQDTMVMGLMTATCGTLLGFIFAYTLVRCDVPFPRVFHVLALLPTISPPFAIAIASILLFGRNGLITRQLFGIRFVAGVNDVYGIDGLVFVQTITFFSVAYLIIRAMLERIDPSVEEAALSMRASKFHIFRTVTLPLLIPGIAGSFLLLFVESLADLGNPLLLAGNTTVLSVEIFLAINGLFDQQKGAALSLVLLIPTLTVFLLQRYYVSRRSYIAVTGKPTGGTIKVTDPIVRWSFISVTALTLFLIILLYTSIVLGSLTRLWGIDYTPDLSHYGEALGRGLNAILSTTFLSAVATPIAGLIGMVVAYMVVRKTFSGKQSLDFISNLGGAVPGTILGIGYIVAFIQAPLIVVSMIYAFFSGYLVSKVSGRWQRRVVLWVLATTLGVGLGWLPGRILFGDFWRYVLVVGYLGITILVWRVALPEKRRGAVVATGLMALLLIIYNLSPLITTPLSVWGRTLPGTTWPKVITRLSSFITVFTQPTMAILGFTSLALALYVISRVRVSARSWVMGCFLMLGAALIFSRLRSCCMTYSALVGCVQDDDAYDMVQCIFVTIFLVPRIP
ncbi:MAG: iron ABC transporter permease [Chloroflexota bacterium]